MATDTSTKTTYICPRCKTDIANRWGFVTTPSVNCHHCGHKCFVTRDYLRFNWANNAFLLAWVVLFVAGMALAITFPSDTSALVWKAAHQGHSAGEHAGAVLGYVAGIFIAVVVGSGVVAVPFGFVGRALATRVAGKIHAR